MFYYSSFSLTYIIIVLIKISYYSLAITNSDINVLINYLYSEQIITNKNNNKTVINHVWLLHIMFVLICVFFSINRDISILFF